MYSSLDFKTYSQFKAYEYVDPDTVGLYRKFKIKRKKDRK